MLVHLEIKNLVLIEALSLEFSPGFNVVTGETGAGKSLIATSLDLLLGKRATADLVRKDKDEAEIAGIFDVSDEVAIKTRLAEAGLGTMEDSELLIRRVVGASRRHKIYINGKLSSLAILTQLAEGLARTMGQHEQHSLFNPSNQRQLLDGFLHRDDLLRQMEEAYQSWYDTRDQLAQLRGKETDRVARLDYLDYQLEEFNQVAPDVDELTKIEANLSMLAHQNTLLETTTRAAFELYDSDGAIFERLGSLSRDVEGLCRFDASLEDDANALKEAAILIEESARTLSAYAQKMEMDPRQIDDLQSRHEQLLTLCRKHGVPYAELIPLQRRMEAERRELEHLTDSTEDLKKKEAVAKKRAVSVAQKLSAARHKGAVQLGEQVTRELADLSFNRSVFSVDVISDDPALEPGPHGMDKVEFRVELNPGEGAHPLRKVASGGELSRMMLAIKRVLAGVGPVGTYVFDEVDTGIGGNVANAVAGKLTQVARHHQIICITHLPQIASAADVHFHIRKINKDSRTHTVVEKLTPEERVSEITRMLGGQSSNDTMIDAARELLIGSGPRSAVSKQKPIAKR